MNLNEVADQAKADVRAVETDIESIAKRAEAAIERWYAAHFKRAVQINAQPITAAEKVALHAAVADAIKPAKE